MRVSVYFGDMRSYFFLLTALFLVSCAPAKAPAPVTHYGVQEGAGSVGALTVTSRDTLYSIAQRYNVRVEDLAIINKLQAPYALKVGQRLKLPAPKTYRLRRGDTLYFLSYMFEVDVEETAALNGLRDPLNLEAGRVLKLPSLSEQRVAVPVETVEQEVLVTPERKPVIASQETVVKPQEKPMDVAKVAEPSQKPSSKSASRIHVDTPKRSSSKFLKPVEGKVISGYGPKPDGLHNDGINIAAARGTPVAAAENGVVVYAGNGLKGSGNLVLVRHDDRWMTAYAHLDSIAVKNGQTLARGAKLGTVGSTGAVNSPQLHFEVRRGTEALNPVPYLGG